MPNKNIKKTNKQSLFSKVDSFCRHHKYQMISLLLIMTLSEFLLYEFSTNESHPKYKYLWEPADSVIGLNNRNCCLVCLGYHGTTDVPNGLTPKGDNNLSDPSNMNAIKSIHYSTQKDFKIDDSWFVNVDDNLDVRFSYTEKDNTKYLARSKTKYTSVDGLFYYSLFLSNEPFVWNLEYHDQEEKFKIVDPESHYCIRFFYLESTWWVGNPSDFSAEGKDSLSVSISYLNYL